MLRKATVVCAAKVKPLRAPQDVPRKRESKIDKRIMAMANREKEITENLVNAQKQEDIEPSMGVERRVVSERLVGTIEDFCIEGPIVSVSQKKPHWRHNYVVDGTLVVKFINKEWQAVKAQPGLEVGAAVSMSCSRQASGLLKVQNMRRANPAEKKALARKAHMREVSRNSTVHETEVRKRIPFAILQSKIAGNLDKDGFKKAILDVYRFVKPEVFDPPKASAS